MRRSSHAVLALLRTQERRHRKHAPVVLRRVGQPELAVDAADVASPVWRALLGRAGGAQFHAAVSGAWVEHGAGRYRAKAVKETGEEGLIDAADQFAGLIGEQVEGAVAQPHHAFGAPRRFGDGRRG